MRAAFALVLVPLVLAGCASGDEPAGPARTTPTATPENADPAAMDEATGNATPAGAQAAHATTTFVNGTITSVGFGAAEPVSFCCPTLYAVGENIDGRFTLDAAPSGILVELVWTDATFDLDLFLEAPDYEQALPHLNGTSVEASSGHSWFDHDGQFGSPDGHASILVTDPEALALTGEWAWFLTTKSSNATPFTVAVTIFHDAPPDPAFSAFAA